MTSLGQLLYGDLSRDDRAHRLGDSIATLGLLTAPVALVPGVLPDIAGSLSALLDMPVGNVALRGWRKHRDIVNAIEETTKDGDRQVVRLARHTISSTHTPSVEVETGGVSQTVLELELNVELDIGVAEIVVEAGRLLETAPGETKATAKLLTGGQTLAKRQVTLLDLSTGTTTSPPPPTGASLPPPPPTG